MKYIISYTIKRSESKTLKTILDKEVETKGKGKKVLRAAIKKQLIEFINRYEDAEWITINRIIQIDELNPNNVFSKDEFKNFLPKALEKKNK